MGDTLHEYMIRKPGVTLLALLDAPYPPLHLEPGDLVVLEKGRALHDKCHAFVDLDGERFLCQLFYEHGKWRAKAGVRNGHVRPEMEIVGGNDPLRQEPADGLIGKKNGSWLATTPSSIGRA
ncbi:hypothetical protein MHN01_02870 [Photobacterium sp. OFAV2-7]|nr:hypothetical protein [Photobacterium sp. OFAV2-7]